MHNSHHLSYALQLMVCSFYYPLIQLARYSLEKSRIKYSAKWLDFRERIKDAVERVEITHEQANQQRCTRFRTRMAQRDDKTDNNDKSSVEGKALRGSFQKRLETTIQIGDYVKKLGQG